jgi:dienelactone hydrolase
MRILHIIVLCALLPAAGLAQSAPSPFDQLAGHFDYPRTASLNFDERGVQMRGKILIIDLTYDGGSDGDHVPAYLVLPRGDGPFAGILWGHWMMKGSPLRNRDEFLDEAVVLARSGVVSLLIDAPMVRPDYKAKSMDMDDDPLEWAVQSSEDERRQIVDLRRGVDLLLSGHHVDPRRIAFVGHSFDAHAGAILAAVEKRINWFVLMAGSFSDEEDIRSATEGDLFRWWQKMGKDKLDQYFSDYAWDDPINYVSHTDGKTILLQFASGDGVTEAQAKKMLARFSAKDKQMQLYQAGHALNSAARLDRDQWLQQHLKLKKLDEEALKGIPQLK